jgi:diguanylate cyclase
MSESRPEDAQFQRDPLTGLPGIEAVHARLAEWIVHSTEAEEGTRLHVMLLGLRRFDAFNLTYGAAAGDLALARVATRLMQFATYELDGPWMAARTGGSNFLLIANETCSRQRWQMFADQLADLVARPIDTPVGTLRLSPRIALLRGVGDESSESVMDRLGQTFTNMQRQQAKRLAWADGETTRAGRTAAQLEGDLLRAADAGEIEVVYQPQFALPSDGLTGAEALARWNHRKLGRIGAASLFNIAERADHIAPLSRHIAQLALAGAASWPEHLRLSLNVTAIELAADSYADELLTTLQETGFPPERLTLEVTEQAMLTDIQMAARTLRHLHDAGIRIALDDFGAGFCNFRYLKILPLDYLKLDRSMVEGITGDARDLAVFRAIVAMARALDLDVIVEGIESEAQRALVSDEGAHCYQGYLRAKPMSAAEFTRLTDPTV